MCGRGCTHGGWQPYVHAALLSTVIPSIIWDEGEFGVSGFQFAVSADRQCLCIGGDGMYGVAFYNLYVLAHAELWVLIEEVCAYVGIVVRPLCAIYQRSALYGKATEVVTDLVVGFHKAWFHVEVYLHHVAFLPCAVYHGIAVVQGMSLVVAVDDFLAVDLDAVLLQEE